MSMNIEPDRYISTAIPVKRPGLTVCSFNSLKSYDKDDLLD